MDILRSRRYVGFVHPGNPDPAPALGPTGDRRRPGLAGTLALLALFFAGGSALAWRSRPAGSCEGVRIETTRGTIRGLLWRPEGEGARPAVLLCHGSSCTKETMETLARPLVAAGLVCLAIDFGSHGESYRRGAGGGSNEEANDDDTRAALDWLGRQVGVDPVRLGIVGHSFGATTAARVGAERPETVRAVAALGQRPAATPERPHDLLVGVGAFEPYHPPSDVTNALRGAWPEGVPVVAGTMVGDLANGDARLLIVDPGADHAGEVYEPRIVDAVASWMAAALGVAPPPPAGDPWLPLGVLARLIGALGALAAVGLAFHRALAARGRAGAGAARVALLPLVGAAAAGCVVERFVPAGETLGADVAVAALLAIPLAAAGMAGARLGRAAAVFGLAVLAYALGGAAVAAPELCSLAPAEAARGLLRHTVTGSMLRCAILCDILRAMLLAGHGGGAVALPGPGGLALLVPTLGWPLVLGGALAGVERRILEATDLSGLWRRTGGSPEARDAKEAAGRRPSGLATLLLVSLLAVAAAILYRRVREGYLQDTGALWDFVVGAFRFLGAPALALLVLLNVPWVRRRLVAAGPPP